MPWLLLDTALPRAVVAIVDGRRGDGPVLAELLLPDTRRHAEALADAVDAVLRTVGLTANALDGIGVGAGPGSFIGVRTGLAYGLGLGRALDRPVVGLDGALALAASVDAVGSGREGEVVVVIDAKRGELYVSRYGHRGGRFVVLAGPRAMAPADVATDGAIAVVGACDGVVIGPDVVTVHLPGPTARGLAAALIHADQTAPPHPVYVRDADARLPSVDPAARRGAVLAALDAAEAREAREADDAQGGGGSR